MVILQQATTAAALQQQGPSAPVLVRVPGGQGHIVTAQVDDGSTISSVDLGVLQGIGAPVVGQETVSTVLGTQTVDTYGASILTSDGLTELLPASAGVLGDNLGGGVQALLGRDVMANLDFAYDGPDGSWALTQPGVIPPRPISPWLYAVAGAVGLAGVGLLLWEVGAAEYRHGRRDERSYEAATRRQIA